MIIRISVVSFRLVAFKTAYPFPGMVTSLPFHDLGLADALFLMTQYAAFRLGRKIDRRGKGDCSGDNYNCEYECGSHDNKKVAFSFNCRPPLG